MSSFIIHNKTEMPIHAATSWDGIVQEFKNGIQPGTSFELPSASFFGWQDLTVVTGFNENEFSHRQDWKHALGLGILIAGSVVTVAGVVVAVGTFGATAPLVPAISAGTLAIAGAVVAGSAGAVTVTDGIVRLVDYCIFPPTVIHGLWGPDGGDIVVSGGDITGILDTKTNNFTVTGSSPLKVEKS